MIMTHPQGKPNPEVASASLTHINSNMMVAHLAGAQEEDAPNGQVATLWLFGKCNLCAHGQGPVIL